MKRLICCLLLLAFVNAFGQRDSFRNMTERNGKIGIGTTNPDELLTVKGKIHTQEVLVDLNGAVAPDYVFDHYFEGQSDLKIDYQMMGLDDLEKYLATHRHLPGIASAKDLEADGLALMTFNLKLLEKIEELTIYTLQQQKEIELLKSELTRLKDE
jgi:hypothetical protein